MKYLLDTCVISELIKKNPDKNVVKWIYSIPESDLYISAITIGEIIKGIEKLTESRRKEDLIEWVTNDLKKRFSNRIIHFDLGSATVWGRVQAKSEQEGKTLPAIDGMIASIGIAHGLTVVTRNISDMAASGVYLYNPWTEEFSNTEK